MKLSEREWTVLNALWETDGAELGVLVTNYMRIQVGAVTQF